MRALAACLLLACSARGSSPAKDAREPLPPLAARDRTVAVNDGIACTLDHGLVCWGSPFDMPGPTDPARPPRHSIRDPPLSPRHVSLPRAPLAVALSTGVSGRHGCVLLEGGEVRCWGYDRVGQLGRRVCETEIFYLPQAVSLAEPAHAIAALGNASCALLEDGRVSCWGHVQSDPERPEGCGPRVVRTTDGAPLRGIARLEVGAGIDADGRVWTWRDRSIDIVVGAVRPSLDETFARPIADLPPAFDLAVTETATYVLTGKGVLWRWAGAQLDRVDARRMGRAIACELRDRCAMATDGPLLGWSTPSIVSADDLEDGFDARPTSLAIARGGCLVEEGSTRCWGDALYGVVAESDIAAAGLVTVR